MSSWNTNNRNDDRKEEPPLSRVFIVCSKDMQKDDLRTAFERFGEIHDIYMPKDRNTGESKGVAYVKYRKTSAAAAAIQEMNLKPIGNSSKPLKVMIAVDKNDSKADITKDDHHNRLFIVIDKKSTEADIRDFFSEFGNIHSIHILKDRSSNESKGLAYIQFGTFLEAAKAVEECDKKFKAIFAAPKQDLKRTRDSSDCYNDMSFNSSSASMHRDIDNYHDYNMMPRNNMPMPRDNMLPLIRAKPQNFNTVYVTCSPAVRQMYIERLFNIIPGIVNFQFSLDNYKNICKAIVTYDDQRAAAHAVESLNHFEFPSGEILSVNPNNPLSKAAEDLSSIVSSFKTAVDAGSPDLTHLAEAIAKASSLIKAAAAGGGIENKQEVPDPNYCSVPLPPLQPMANPDSKVAERCFIVCKPQPPSPTVLRDVFRRFGDLIDVYILQNKTFGFARFASVGAAQRAIKTLHGAMVCGVRLKVLEANEKASKDSEYKIDSDVDHDNYMDTDNVKRTRVIEHETFE